MPPFQADRGTVWPQVETTTLADRVYLIVRNRILQRDLSPGTFIREQEVSRATGVSRTPVREALNRLASQNFLERVPHRGFRVPERPWETLLEVYPIVASLEVLAGSLSFERIGPSDLARLRELNDRLAEAGRRGDARAQVDLNNAFHEVFSERSGNQRLSELLNQLRSQVVLLDTWYFSLPEHVEASVTEHTAIVDAIEAHDFPAAAAMLEKNYFRGRMALEKEMNRQLGRLTA